MGGLKEGRKSLIARQRGVHQHAAAAAAQSRRRRCPARQSGARQSERRRRTIRNEIARDSSPTSTCSRICGTSTTRPTATTSPSTRSIRAGCAVFEFDIDETVGSSETDRQYLNATMDTLRTLAENTDGRAIVNRNDLDGGHEADHARLSAYYLLGYSSSQADRRQVPRDQGPRETPGRAGARAQGLLGAQRRADVAARWRRRSRLRRRPVTAALNSVASSTDACASHPHLDRHVARRERQDARHVRLGADAANGRRPPARTGRTAGARVADGRRPERFAVFPGACPGYGGGVGVARRCVLGAGAAASAGAGLARGLRRDARQDAAAPVGRGRLQVSRFRNPRNHRARISPARRRRSARPCCSAGARRGTSSR